VKLITDRIVEDDMGSNYWTFFLSSSFPHNYFPEQMRQVIRNQVVRPTFLQTARIGWILNGSPLGRAIPESLSETGRVMRNPPMLKL
jgi:hypothetical protein